MGYCGSFKALPILVKTQSGGFLISSTKSIFQSKVCVALQAGRIIYGRRRIQPMFVAVANSEYSVGTPLEPISPEGKLLGAILQRQRCLFHYAVSEQLNELASERNEAAARKNHRSDCTESLLHRRITEMEEEECQIAIEEIIYMSIVHKFSEVEVPMVPKLSKYITNDKLEIWPSKCKELESIHSLEFQEIITEHLAAIMSIREKSNATEDSTATKMDRLHLGRIYAASILLGYFLKSACFRRQLDLSLTRSGEDLQPSGHKPHRSVAELYPWEINTDTLLLDNSLCQQSQTRDTRREKLQSYVTGFDTVSFQRCAKLKSKEAVNVIEKHTFALFGDEKISELGLDNVVITFPSLERLVLEAVAFGSFLWVVERSVDSVYPLKEN